MFSSSTARAMRALILLMLFSSAPLAGLGETRNMPDMPNGPRCYAITLSCNDTRKRCAVVERTGTVYERGGCKHDLQECRVSEWKCQHQH